jgi:ubiquinone/menaquinone biosynthesis C-methylase UbiE
LAPITSETVQSYFNAESRAGRRLLPNEQTVSGLGTYVKYRRAASLMAESRHIHVLDIGCNRGSVEFLFQQLYSNQISSTLLEGVDILNDAIQQAKALDLPNCHFQVYDGLHLPYSSASFDLIIMIEVIEHVIQKEELLKEVHRVLRSGGHLFLTTPNPESFALKSELLLWNSLRWFLRRRPPEKDAFISHDLLENTLARQRFQLVGQETMYDWPRLYIYFQGWSILPPLPPKWLLIYQQFCVDHLHSRYVPKWLAKRIYWSLVGLLEKQDMHTDSLLKNDVGTIN